MEAQCMRRCRSKQHGASIVAAILRGTEQDSVAYIRWLCSNCAHVTDNLGRNALHIAASKGKRRVCEWLVKNRDAIINVRDFESGYTALHRSILYGQIHVAVSLIKLGANVASLDKEDLTPIQHAMKSRLSRIEYTKNAPGEAYVWGANANYNLGLGGNEQSRSIPELMEHFRRAAVNIKQVALNMYHSVFVSDSGKVYSCGHGQGGRLGQESEKASLLPQPVKLPASEVCVQVSISNDHTVLLMESGSVWTCGSNKYHQLGHHPDTKALLTPRSIPSKHLPYKVLGVCAGRFHTVIWAKEAVLTCGLNAGQLGHPKVDPTIPSPKQVPSLKTEDCHITHVAASDAATVVALKKGTIYVLHEYKCRAIASKMLHVKQVAVTGGRLDAVPEHINEELKVCVLTTTGQILLWQESTQQLTKCMLQLKRLLIVTDLAMTNQQFLFATQDGEAFEGFVQPRRKSVQTSSKNNNEADDWEYVRVRCVANIHRAVSVSCDPRGRNFAVVQTHPKTSLLEIPHVESSNMKEHMLSLLKVAPEEDDIQDIIFEVDGRKFAAHRCIVRARSEILAQMITDVDPTSTLFGDEIPVIKIPELKSNIFEQFLQFIYTNQCDFLVPGPYNFNLKEEEKNKPNEKSKKKKKKGENNDDEINFNPKSMSAFQAYQDSGRKGKTKWKTDENGNSKTSSSGHDPIRDVAASARKLGLQALSKALDSVQYRDQEIRLRGNHNVYKPTKISFDRSKMQKHCDVVIRSLDGKEMSAHRSILAARLEYFYSMFAHGWAEAGRNSTLTMALPSHVLEVLLDFLYLDEAPEMLDNPELARTMLVVADQMFIERLKEICEAALAATITLKNAPELLQLAATYNADQLKLCCMQFISINLPAFLESRTLEEVEWSVLEDLTKYHREITPAMWYRTMTPYSEGPSTEEIESISASFPVDLDIDCTPEERKEMMESKKAKAKKLKKLRRVSSGEGWRTRKESVSSNASDCSEDLENVAPPVHLKATEEEGITLTRIETPPVTPPAAEPPVNVAVLEEKKKKWNSMFPDLNTALTVSDQRQQKVSEKKTMTKLSQKEKKRLASEGTTPGSVGVKATPTSARPAWGMQPASAESSSVNNVLEDKKNKSSPTKSIPIPVTPQRRQPSVSSPQSPGQVWGIPDSPLSPDTSIGKLSLEAIVADELQQKKNLSRVRAKSLHLTQIEDKAIDDLLEFYNANNCSMERITVRRVDTGTVATPTWVSSHR